SRVAHPHPPLRRHHPEIARRLRRSLRRPQARPPRRTSPAKSRRPGNRPRTARPPLPAPEKHRRDLLPRAPSRPGNLRVPAGPPVTPMRTPVGPFAQLRFGLLCAYLCDLCASAVNTHSRLATASPSKGEVSRTVLSLVSLLSLSATLAFAQQPQQRDLKVERLDTVPAAKPLQIPVSYAVIVGISRYRNLADKDQLQFAERYAQSIFTALISPEGGNFRVENVHLLTGDKATLANVRREIGTWLPSVAKPDDRVLIYFAGHGF